MRSSKPAGFSGVGEREQRAHSIGLAAAARKFTRKTGERHTRHKFRGVMTCEADVVG